MGHTTKNNLSKSYYIYLAESGTFVIFVFSVDDALLGS